jgi:hypothetical protein
MFFDEDIRASASPPARQLITQAALKGPLFAAAQRAWQPDHPNPMKTKSPSAG